MLLRRLPHDFNTGYDVQHIFASLGPEVGNVNKFA